MSQADIVSSASCLIHKDMVRESIDKMKNWKAAGSSSLLLGMVKSAGEAGINIIADLVNHELFQQNGKLALM